MIVHVDQLQKLFHANEVIFENCISRFHLNLVFDSRQIKPGDTFLCLAGEKVDGHDFIEEAIQKGAIGFIVNHKVSIPSRFFQVITNSTEIAIQSAAKNILKESTLKQIAITGSAGKTTTKEILYTLFSSFWKTYKTIGNFNTPIGVPLSIINMNDIYDYFICELSASYPGEIDQNLSYMDLESGIITGIGSSHLEFFGSTNAIFLEKMKISNYIRNSGILLINGDQEWSQKAKKQYENTLSFGFKNQNDIQAIDLDRKEGRITFTVRIHKKKFPGFTISTFGDHFIYDALPGIYLAMQKNISIDKIKQTLVLFQAERGRGRVIRFLKNSIIIDESYNANPYSFAVSLKSFAESNFNRRIAIIGDMLELGPDSYKLHYELGKLIQSYKISVVLYIGEYKEALQSGLQGSSVQFIAKEDLSSLQSVFLSILEEGDGVMVKASNGIGLHQLINRLEKLV